MDSNICGSATDADASINGLLATNSNPCLIAWHAENSDNTYGPDTAMIGLYNATKDWINVPAIDLSGTKKYTDDNNNGTDYGYTEITTNKGVATITGKPTTKKTVIGTESKPLRARLPKESEVTSNKAGCHFYNEYEDYGTCSAWLVENLAEVTSWCTVCLEKYSTISKVNNVFGYWLLDSHPDLPYYIHFVNHIGAVHYNFSTSYDGYNGICPVITVSKSDLSS